MNTAIRYVIIATVMFGFLGCALFVIAYQIRSRGDWWRTPEGRYLMFNNATLGALFLQVLTNRLYGEWVGRDIVTMILMLAFAGLTFAPYTLLRGRDDQLRAERRANAGARERSEQDGD